MIREIVNFSNILSETFKGEGVKPREGLHILLKTRIENGELRIDCENYEFEIYLKKSNVESAFISKCKTFAHNSWCIDTNKCFDLPTKAIHSCSPYLVAFKREHLEGGSKYAENKKNNKSQLSDRLGAYFEKANTLIVSDKEKSENQAFESFFIKKKFENIFSEIEIFYSKKTAEISDEVNFLKAEILNHELKQTKEDIKLKINELELQLEKYKKLEDNDYILYYLDKELSQYKTTHEKYLSENLFNTNKYNTIPNKDGLIWGTSNFMNGFDSNKPFLLHRTASFDITSRISNKDAKALHDFNSILSRGILPNPLPLFIYHDELQSQVISLFNESGNRIGFSEIVRSLWEKYPEDFRNYYFLYWQNTKKGLEFQDFDFVTKFEFKIDDIYIRNLFDIKAKKTSEENPHFNYGKITDIFDFESLVFKPILQNKFLKLDYFKNLDSNDYMELNLTFHAYCKYRKIVFDFIYKSRRQGIDSRIFSEMVFSRIRDEIKTGNEYGIKEKLNIWYSVIHYFSKYSKLTYDNMASKLKNYQEFVSQLAVGQIDLAEANDSHFAFAAGQVIEYVVQKSRSDNKSYQLLEPYLQQSKCSEFKKALANDIARYKHAINANENRFKNVCAFVQTYETERNMKELLPELLGGIFSKNEFFTIKIEKDSN